MSPGIRYYAFVCENPAEALTLVYLAVCCHITGQQLPARISPEWDASADIGLPSGVNPLASLQRAAPSVKILEVKEFTPKEVFPDPETTRGEVLTKLRAVMAA